LFNCFESSLDENPECSQKVKLVLRRAAKKLVGTAPNCVTVGIEEEQETSREVTVPNESFQTQFERDGFEINIQVKFPKNKKYNNISKKKKTDNMFLHF